MVDKNLSSLIKFERTVPRRYFWFGFLCLLLLVSVSILFSPSVCLDNI